VQIVDFFLILQAMVFEFFQEFYGKGGREGGRKGM